MYTATLLKKKTDRKSQWERKKHRKTLNILQHNTRKGTPREKRKTTTVYYRYKRASLLRWFRCFLGSRHSERACVFVRQNKAENVVWNWCAMWRRFSLRVFHLCSYTHYLSIVSSAFAFQRTYIYGAHHFFSTRTLHLLLSSWTVVESIFGWYHSLFEHRNIAFVRYTDRFAFTVLDSGRKRRFVCFITGVCSVEISFVSIGMWKLFVYFCFFFFGFRIQSIQITLIFYAVNFFFASLAILTKFEEKKIQHFVIDVWL